MDILISIYITYSSLVNGVDPSLVHGIVKTESRYVVEATGAIGEVGLMQIRPIYWQGPLCLYHAETNISKGVQKLANLKRLEDRLGSNWFVAYNLGPTGALEYSKNNDISIFDYALKVKKHKPKKLNLISYHY